MSAVGIYKPDALPFWETTDGDGPIAKKLRDQEGMRRRVSQWEEFWDLKTEILRTESRIGATRGHLSRLQSYIKSGRVEHQILQIQQYLDALTSDLELLVKRRDGLRHDGIDDRYGSRDPDSNCVRVGGADGNGNRWIGHGVKYR